MLQFIFIYVELLCMPPLPLTIQEDAYVVGPRKKERIDRLILLFPLLQFLSIFFLSFWGGGKRHIF